MRRLPLLASNSHIASISIDFRSGEAVRATTDRSGPTGNVPLHENRLAGRESVGCVQPVDAPEPLNPMGDWRDSVRSQQSEKTGAVRVCRKAGGRDLCLDLDATLKGLRKNAIAS